MYMFGRNGKFNKIQSKHIKLLRKNEKQRRKSTNPIAKIQNTKENANPNFRKYKVQKIQKYQIQKNMKTKKYKVKNKQK